MFVLCCQELHVHLYVVTLAYGYFLWLRIPLVNLLLIPLLVLTSCSHLKYLGTILSSISWFFLILLLNQWVIQPSIEKMKPHLSLSLSHLISLLSLILFPPFTPFCHLSLTLSCFTPTLLPPFSLLVYLPFFSCQIVIAVSGSGIDLPVYTEREVSSVCVCLCVHVCLCLYVALSLLYWAVAVFVGDGYEDLCGGSAVPGLCHCSQQVLYIYTHDQHCFPTVWILWTQARYTCTCMWLQINLFEPSII